VIGAVVPNPPTVTFIVMLAVVIASSAAGYAARRRGWVRESAARPILLITLIAGYPVVSTLPVWVRPLQLDDLWILVQCVRLPHALA